MRRVVFSVFVSVLGASSALQAQDAPAATKASPYVSVSGAVTKVDAAGKVLTVKPDKGEADTTVKFDERTSFMKLPAGETDAKKATAVDSKEVEAGDKIVARVLTADPTGKPARTVLFTKATDLVKLHQMEEEAWKTATSGLVTSMDAAAKQIKFNVKVAGSPAPKEVALDISGKVDFQRYNPDSGKYEAGKVEQIKIGDQLRVLGDKAADMSSIKAKSIGFGSFKTLGVLVKTIDAATNTITGTETASKKPVTIGLRADTSLKKFSDMAAMMVARQINPSYQGAGGGRGGPGGGAGGPGGGAGGPGGGGFGPGGGGRGQGGAPPAGGPPQGMVQPGMGAGQNAPGGPGGGMGAGGMAGGRGGPGGGMGGRGGGRGGMDIGRIIEQQPSIQLSDLKAGDAIIVTGATGNDPARLTATALVAGVEPILRAAPSNGADPLAGSWSMGGGGDGGGGGN